jgi:arginyl-tRNA synthetase
VQYAALRMAKILKRFVEEGGQIPDFAQVLTPDAMARQLADEDLWQYVLQASKVEAAIEQAVSSGEPSHVARFAFQVAQTFSGFYDKYQVKDEKNPEKLAFLLWLTGYFRTQLESTLKVLGIEVPEYM